jgi:hypothetical protein
MYSKIIPQPGWPPSVAPPRPGIVLETVEIQADEHRQSNRDQNDYAFKPALVVLKPNAMVENTEDKLRNAQQRSQHQGNNNLVQERVPEPC